jgi:hypothetical protein
MRGERAPIGELSLATPAGQATVTLVDVLLPVGVSAGDAKVQVTATEGTEQEKVIAWLNPPVANTLKGTETEVPAVTAIDVAPGESEKFGGANGVALTCAEFGPSPVALSEETT